ncbi:uncharacterized protein LOC132934491 [Metopolophium dirhodum]|uniref:uncharacterized protein LOC132934491 n=1 Tax=Metopolophium dirhodum TaxID=44670 RepID=UPI00298F585F|nr:uncharacterized protein LOC132934491 [Metopolophium dirhodum]
MLSKKNVKITSLYKERIELLALHYPYNDEEHTLVGNIQLIDVMGTLKSTAKKLFNKLPSYTNVNCCKNMLCPNYMTVQKYPVISLCAFDDYINVQEEIEKYFSTEEIDCIECPSRRKNTFNAKSHILIELMSLPKELEESTSYADITEICNVPQNYVKPVLWDLEEIPKILIIRTKEYYLRSAIVFVSGDRYGLRVSTGHYKSIVWRDNERWEVYDDLKETATNPHGKKQNVEFLIYTI